MIILHLITARQEGGGFEGVKVRKGESVKGQES